jgi:hypothetical protein
MSVDTDRFITAMFALWAGDFEYAETLLSDYTNERPLNGAVESPEELIRRTGLLRLRQLRQKKGEFKLLAAEHDLRDQVQATPDVLETTHIRGALWRLGPREFNLLAYLTDLQWQEQMLGFAREQAELYEHYEPATSGRRQRPLQRELRSMASSGVAWTVTGSVLMQAHISDLCLLEVNGIWTLGGLPNTNEEIRGPFLKLLHALDPDSVRILGANAKQSIQ